MEKRIISISNKTKKGGLDDDYTLYGDGTVLHEYDTNTFINGLNRKESLTVYDLSDEIKMRIFNDATEENKSLVSKILELNK